MTKSVERGYVAAMARAVAAEQPDAIMIVCSNLNSAQWVDELERELKPPIYDSLSAVVWHALKLAGIDPAPIHHRLGAFVPAGWSTGLTWYKRTITSIMGNRMRPTLRP